MLRTVVGYTGGMRPNPTYESVCAGDGHAEAIRIEYDPQVLRYEDLLYVFWSSHTPSPDCGGGAQYKSAIWYHDDHQRELAVASIQAHGNLGRMVEVEREQPWWNAEDYHQKFLQRSYGN